MIDIRNTMKKAKVETAITPIVVENTVIGHFLLFTERIYFLLSSAVASHHTLSPIGTRISSSIGIAIFQ